MTAAAAPVSAEHVAAGAQDYYVVIIVFLLASAVVVPLFQRYRVSGVLGFLAVGVLLGPDGVGRLIGNVPGPLGPVFDAFALMRSHSVHALAELGVVFLLFSIGLELTFERLKSLRRLVFGLGLLQVAISSLVLAGLFFWLGQGIGASAALGMALALSSTAMVLPALADRKALRTASGRSVFAVLLAQDLSVAPILITVGMLTAGEAGKDGAGGLLALIPALIGMGVLVVAGRWLLRPLFTLVAASKSRELFMAACLLVVLVSGQVAVLAGLSMGLGAFVAGVLLAETEYRREIEVLIDPFKGLLLGLFFVTVGARLDIGEILAQPVFVLGLTAALMALKAVAIYPMARAFGLNRRGAIETAAILGPAGEFAFVIVDEAIGRHILAADFGQAVILSATLSLFFVPLLAAVSGRIAGKLAPSDPPPAEAPDTVSEDNPVIIVGYGRVGALVADMLKVHAIGFSVVDINPRVVAAARAAGVEAWYGDASVPDFMERLGLAKAKAVVVTASNATFTDTVVEAVHGARPDVHVIARARDAGHAERLYRLGATDAVPETIEASLQLAENTLIDLGVPMGLVLASVHEQRDVFRRMFGVRSGPAVIRMRGEA
jgi:CPA2 family monovalent cation:H+ antiporter-2